LTGIEITTKPTKIEYVFGQCLDLTGMVVKRIYNDGTKSAVDVTATNISGFDSSKVGSQTVTVTVYGQTATFTMNVIAKSVTRIAITAPPTKTAYVEGQNFDAAGMVITATYNDATTAVVTRYSINPAGALTMEDTKVIVSYEGKTTDQTITVAAKALTGIEITTKPTKIEYIVGQSLDLTGMVVTGKYNDGTRATIPVTPANISGFDSSKTGSQTVIVTVGNWTATFDVNVKVQFVTGIAVAGLDGVNIVKLNKNLQMHVLISPDNATNKTVTWSVKNGTVTVIATAKDGSGIKGSVIINAVIPATTIMVKAAKNATGVAVNAKLQMTVSISPTNATIKNVTWSVKNGTGSATIDQSGLLTGTSGGTVTITATAKDGSGVYGSIIINVIQPVTRITVTDVKVNGNLQMNALVTPDNATNKTVTWSVKNGTGSATINSSGLLSATKSGTVTVIATAKDGSRIAGSAIINVAVPVTTIMVKAAKNATSVAVNAKLQIAVSISPTNATIKNVTWSVKNGTGSATIDQSGLLTGTSGGTVTITATAKDGSGIQGSTIINLVVSASKITVKGAKNATSVTVNNNLQITASTSPANALDKTVTWSVENGTGSATINQSGLLTGISGGTVTVTATATAKDGSGVHGFMTINVIQPVTRITVTGLGGVAEVKLKGTLQMNALITPDGATNEAFTWSVKNGTGSAKISSKGLLTAAKTGTVTVIATAKDGSGVKGTITITITK